MEIIEHSLTLLRVDVLTRYQTLTLCKMNESYLNTFAQDIEWAKDGDDGKLYVVQARPETVHSTTSSTSQEVFSVQGGTGAYATKLLCEGRSIGAKVGVGR